MLSLSFRSLFKRKQVEAEKPLFVENLTDYGQHSPKFVDGVYVGRYEVLHMLEHVLDSRSGLIKSADDPAKEVMDVVRCLKLQMRPKAEVALDKTSNNNLP